MRDTSRLVRLSVLTFLLSALAACSTEERPPQRGDGGALAAGGTGGEGQGGTGGAPGTGGTGGVEAQCGNGIPEEGEECDEGAENSDDTPDRCREDCTLPRCGDGVIDEGEACFRGEEIACIELDAGTEGRATCTSDCAWDLSACWAPQHCLDEEGVADCSDPRCAAIKDFCPTCGDGEATGDELCDGADLRGASCRSEGFPSGTLACAADCEGFSTADCSLCGNQEIDEGEECDTTNLDGNSCKSLGFSGGFLSCMPETCTLNTASCTQPVCGDGVRHGEEECDGSDFGGLSCSDFGFPGGDLACDGCAIDTSGCGEPDPCGNGLLDAAEECDDGNKVAGDGCDSSCLLESGVCGANIINLNQVLVPIPGEEGMEYTGTLVGAGDDSTNTCQTTTGLDQVHSLYVEDQVLVHVMVESLAPVGTMPLSASITTNCADTNAELACNSFGDDVSKAEVGVDAGTQVYITIDTDDGTHAGDAYRLAVYLFPMARKGEACGDGILCEPPYRCGSTSGVCSECPKFGPCP